MFVFRFLVLWRVCPHRFSCSLFRVNGQGLTVVRRKQMAVRKETDGKHEGKGWLSGQVRADRILAEAVTIDGRKEWCCRFCSGNERVDEMERPQLVSAKVGVYSSGSSSSSGGRE